MWRTFSCGWRSRRAHFDKAKVLDKPKNEEKSETKTKEKPEKAEETQEAIPGVCKRAMKRGLKSGLGKLGRAMICLATVMSPAVDVKEASALNVGGGKCVGTWFNDEFEEPPIEVWDHLDPHPRPEEGIVNAEQAWDRKLMEPLDQNGAVDHWERVKQVTDEMLRVKLKTENRTSSGIMAKLVNE